MSYRTSSFELEHFFALLGAFAALPGRVRARLLYNPRHLCARILFIDRFYTVTSKANRENRKIVEKVRLFLLFSRVIVYSFLLFITTRLRLKRGDSYQYELL